MPRVRRDCTYWFHASLDFLSNHVIVLPGSTGFCNVHKWPGITLGGDGRHITNEHINNESGLVGASWGKRCQAVDFWPSFQLLVVALEKLQLASQNRQSWQKKVLLLYLPSVLWVKSSYFRKASITTEMARCVTRCVRVTQNRFFHTIVFTLDFYSFKHLIYIKKNNVVQTSERRMPSVPAPGIRCTHVKQSNFKCWEPIHFLDEAECLTLRQLIKRKVRFYDTLGTDRLQQQQQRQQNGACSEKGVSYSCY